MRSYPRNFGFQQDNSLIQFTNRISVQAFQAKLMSSISTRANPTSGEINVLHCSAASTGFCLLSIRDS